MTRDRIVNGVKMTVARFRRAERGNVAMMFALMLPVLLTSVGAAVDYGRAVNARSAMQAAVDATALMISREAAGLTAAEITSKAQAYFNALYTHPQVADVTFSADYSPNSGSGATIVVNATGSMPTDFMKLAGYSSMPLNASSTTKWGNSRLRVALVLDTTGSMNSSNKIGALKTATKDLIDKLKAAATQADDIYVSIIPFSKSVNLGSSNYNATWLGWEHWEAEPPMMSSWLANSTNLTTWEQTGPGSSCPLTNAAHGFRCASSPTSTTIVSSVPSSGTYSGYICPSTDTGGKISNRIGIMHNGCYNSVASTREISSGGSASCGTAVNCSCSGGGSKKVCTQSYYQHNWIKNARSTWNGCVTDRGASGGPSGDYDRLTNAPVSGTAASFYPAEQDSYCSPQTMPLSNNWSSMKSLVDTLYPLGATNQPIGLVWGWQSLVGGGPFTVPPKDPNYAYQDVIILMSDGLNTLDRWYGNGSSTNTSVDGRMLDTDGSGTCANVKAANITLYTIHFNTDGDPLSTLLQNCASSPDKFWMVTTNNDFIALFNNLGTKLSQLRISQ